MKQPSQETTPSSRWYQNITNLPLSKFIDVLIDNNLYALVISGEPTKEQLAKAWEEIKIQYADAMKDNEYKLMVKLNSEVTKLNIVYNQVLIGIDTLRQFHCVQIARAVNRCLRTSFKFDPRFPDDYDNDLKRAYNRNKGFKIDMDLKQSALDGIKTKYMSRDSKPTREYFASILITLSDKATYRLSDDMSVFEFCDRVRRLNEYYSSQKQTDGRRGKDR